MKRKEKKAVKKCQWKNTGAIFRLPGRIIKPNQVFSAEPNEIPKGFRDVLQCLTPELLSIEQDKLLHESEVLFTTKIHSKGWFDVINSDGKIVNEKRLRRTDAEDLCEQLNISKQ